MKRIVSIGLVLAMVIYGLSASSTNLENIYGKNDLNINNNLVYAYGNNFGSVIESNIVEPYSMEIEVAQSEIDLLMAKNTVFSNENSEYVISVKGIEERIAVVYDLIARIDSVLNTVISTSTELYTLSTNLTDTEMRQELQLSIEENRQQKYDLENKRLNLEKQMSSLKNTMDVKKRYITVNNLNVRRNLQRIDFLKTCIELSKKDTSALERAVNRSSGLQSEVDAILNTSF